MYSRRVHFTASRQEQSLFINGLSDIRFPVIAQDIAGSHEGVIPVHITTCDDSKMTQILHPLLP